MIEARNLCYRYVGGSRNAVNDISVTLESGGMTAILGANGSGKSTLALLLAGLLAPASGRVEVDGMPSDSPAGRGTIRKNVGIIFQDPTAQFTSPSVERELAFGLQNQGIPSGEIATRVDDSLRMFDLVSLRAVPPSELSGGEQQRLAFASVMILQPGYLILDEPTSLLSPRSRGELFQRVTRTRSPGILLITQFPREVMVADQVIVLHEGEIALRSETGDLFSHSTLLERCNIPVPLRYRSLS